MSRPSTSGGGGGGGSGGGVVAESGGVSMTDFLPPPGKRTSGRSGAMVAGSEPAEEASSLRGQVQQLKEDLDRRQSAYIRREREYRARIELLEHQLAKSRSSRVMEDFDDPMAKARQLHKNILGRIEQVQGQTGRILQEQERDLLRAFRARLFDVQTELEKMKSKNEDKAASWIEKTQQLEKELDWAKEMADRLDRHNQSLTRENSRLKTQFKTQEDDREYLIRQLVAAKKDNARLRQDVARLQQTADKLQKDADDRAVTTLQTTLPLTVGRARTPTAAAGAVRASTPSKSTLPPVGEERYREVIMRLKKLLETERSHLKQVRTTLATELQQRTELEVFLRQCVEDVRQDIARKRVDMLSTAPVADAEAKVPALSEFESSDREKVMELLLSQERVVNLLYARTFPRSAEAPAS